MPKPSVLVSRFLASLDHPTTCLFSSSKKCAGSGKCVHVCPRSPTHSVDAPWCHNYEEGTLIIARKPFGAGKLLLPRIVLASGRAANDDDLSECVADSNETGKRSQKNEFNSTAGAEAERALWYNFVDKSGTHD